jgi:hypothetical protein
MAALKNNGAEVLRVRSPQGVDIRVMSNGKCLAKRPSGGGFRVVKGPAALASRKSQTRAIQQEWVDRQVTFAALKAHVEHCAPHWSVEVLSQAWLDLRPAPTKRFMRKAPTTARQEQWVDRVNPGLIRAMADQKKG